MSASDPLTEVVPARWHAGYRPRVGLVRLRDSWIAILQIVLAASASFALAHLVLGHETPLLAATVTISSLGLLRDARPARVLQTIAGMLTGIAIAEVMLVVTDSGWWQLALVLVVTLTVGRFVSPAPEFAVAAAIQSAIAFTLPLAQFPGERLLDGAIGGACALVVTALLPRNPMGAVLRDARLVFDDVDRAMTRVVQGLSRGDRLRAERGLSRARDLQQPIAVWGSSLESGQAISSMSPFLSGRRTELARLRRMQRAMDLATRNLRVLARRAHYAVEDSEPRPELAEVVARVQEAVRLLAASLDDDKEDAARERLREIAASLDPAALLPRARLGDQNVIASLRPMVVDLLVGAGMSRDDAAHAIPRI